MKKFYMHDGKNQMGPYDLDDLRTKGITKNTPIWYEGVTDWINAENIDELKDLFRISTPPPFNNSEKLKPAVKSYKAWNIFRYTAAGIIIGFLLFAYLLSEKEDNSTYEQKVISIEEIEQSSPTDFLIAHGTYQENFWGDKINVNCEITNNATVVSYKDAIVRVTYYSKTKTALGSNEYTLYEVFTPTSKKTIPLKIDNYKNVSSIGWEVIGASKYE